MTPTEPSAERRCRQLIVALVFGSVASFNQSGQDNENSHFCQLGSLLWRGQLWIGECAYRTADVIEVAGKVYPNKPPGENILAFPIWAAFQFVLKHLVSNEGVRNEWTAYLTTICTTGIAAVVIALSLFSVLRAMEYSLRAATWLALGGVLGTILFPFSTLFFSHTLTTAVGFAAFTLLFRNGRAVERSERQHALTAFFAGLLLGFVPSIDYPAAICSGIVGCYGLTRLRTNRARLMLVLGGLVGVAPLLIYNWFVFHNPLFVTYAAYATDAEHNNFFPEHRKGILGFSLPRPDLLYAITFGSQRGLLYINPWLTLGFLGAAILIARARSLPFRAERFVAFLICGAFLAMNASYGESISFWGGGASTGPRHCIPAIPFLVLLVAISVERWGWLQRLTWLVGWCSAGAMLLATAVEPRVGYEFTDPLRQLFWRNFLLGRFALYHHGVFTNATLFGIVGAWNLGSLLRLPGYFQLVPILTGWSIGTYLLSRTLERHAPLPRFAAVERWFCLVPLLFGFIPWLHTLTLPHCRGGEVSGFAARMVLGVPFGTPPETFQSDRIPENTVVDRRTDANIDFDWSDGNFPLESPFTIHWSSQLLIEQGGYYRFATDSDDGSAVYIDGDLLVNNWGVHGSQRVERSVALSTGIHHLDVLYYNDRFGGLMHLTWTPPGSGPEKIPDHLLHSVCQQ